MSIKSWFGRRDGSRGQGKAKPSFKNRSMAIEALEYRQLLTITSPFLLDWLARETPHYQPSADQPPAGIEKVTLSLYTEPALPPDHGFPEFIEFNSDLQVIRDGILNSTDERPAYWIEPLDADAGDYRVHLNDNGMPVQNWSIDWGDFGPIEKVGNTTYVDHHYQGMSGGDSILVSGNGIAYTYEGFAPGVIGNILDQGGDRDMNRVIVNQGGDVDVVNDPMPERPPVVSVVGDQTASSNMVLDLPELGSFSHYATVGDFTYQIDWGDGTASDTGIATIVSEGYGDIPSVGSFGGQHIYSDPGVYYIAATVTDPVGGTDTQTVRVLVNQSVVVDTSNLGGDQSQTTDLGQQDQPTPFIGPLEPTMQSMVSGQDTSGSDPALLAAVRRTLGLPADAIVWSDDWARLTSLSADSNKVASLAGMQYAVNLQSFTLVPSDFSDPGHLAGSSTFSQLNNLSNLRSLTLQRCSLTGSELTASILNTLPLLTTLDLRYNNINQVSSAIVGVSSLATLSLYGNPLKGNGTDTWYKYLSGKLIHIDIAPDHPEKALTAADPITELAKAFYYLPIEMYEYVLNTIEYQPYQGAMKGPIAVLQTGAGNDWDTDSLLAGLFSKAGITTEYYWGQIAEDVLTVEKWLGVKTAAATFDALCLAGLRPQPYDQFGAVITNLSLISTADYFKYDHAWLEASVTPPGSSSAQTVYLDPTWKFRDFQPGLSGMITTKPFNDTLDASGYLRSDYHETASEYYEGQVRDYLKTSHPEMTIADVAYDGPIRPQSISALPTDLQKVRPLVVTDHQSTIPNTDTNHLVSQVRISLNIPQSGTVNCTQNANGTITIVASSPIFTQLMSGSPIVLDNSTGRKAFSIPAISTATYTITVLGTSGNNGAFTSAFSLPDFSTLQNVPDISLERITVGYTTGTNLTPHLYLNGTEASYNIPPTVAVPSGSRVDLVVQSLPGTTGGTVAAYNTVFSRAAGNYLAVGLDAWQTSEQMLVQLRQTVNDANMNQANDSNWMNGTQPSGAPNRDLLAGGLLHLALADYFHKSNSGEKSTAGLTWALPLYNAIGCGVATAYSDPTDNSSQNGDLQIRYLPSQTGIDIPDGYWNSSSIDETLVTISGNQRILTATDIDRDKIMGYTNSAMEALVWEELTNTPGISTIKSLQMASTNTALLTDVGQVSSALAALTDTNGPQIRTDVSTFISQGYNVLVPKEYTTVGTGVQWHGIGYILINTTTGRSEGYVIDNGVEKPHGGWTGGNADPVNILSSTINSAWATVGDPIEISNGNVVHDEADINIPNLGVPLAFGRHYASNTTVPLGQAWSDRGMGEGWSFTYSDTLTSVEGNKVWFTDSGIKLTFEPATGGGWKTPETIYGSLWHDPMSGAYQWTDKTGNKVIFDSNGVLVQMNDRFGNGVVVHHDASGHLDYVYDLFDSSRRLTFTYSGNHIASISDFTGRTWLYGYDSASRLVSVTAPISSTMPLSQVQYGYYPETDHVRKGLLQTVTDPDSNVTHYDYYLNRRGFKVTDAEGNTHSVSHDIYRNRTSFTDERGQTSYYVYDSEGNLTQQIAPNRTTTTSTWVTTSGATWKNCLKTADTDAYGQTESYVYSTDGLGNVMQFTDRMNQVTDYAYYTGYTDLHTVRRESDNTWTTYNYFTDSGKNTSLSSVVDALGNTTSYTYPSTNRGQSRTMMAPQGNAQHKQYGDHGPYGYTTIYDYNDAGQMISRVTPVFTYDPSNSPHNPDMNITESWDYDNRGYLLSSTDGLGAYAGDPAHTTTYTYDLLGHLLSQTSPDPDGSGPLFAPVTTSVYDAAGLLLSTGLATSNPQRTTGSVYDKMRRATKTVNADGTYRTLQYDPFGNPAFSTDELGRVTQYVYDRLNRLVATIKPDGSVGCTEYDGGGRIVGATDALTNVTRYTYDKLGRKNTVIQPDPNGGTNTATTQYFYDAQGNLQYVVNAQGSGTGDTAHTTRYYYDKIGRKTADVLPDPDGSSNPLLSPITLYSYNANGSLVSIVDARGASEDVLNGNGGVSDPSSNDGMHKTQYLYDEMGRKIGEILPDPDGASGPMGTLSTWYYYDANSNLQYVVNPNGASLYRPVIFYYYMISPNYTTEYVYDALNRKTKEIDPDPDGGGSRPTTNFDYDNNGNLAAVTDPLKNVTRSIYDVRNRAIQTTDALGAYAGDPAHTTTATYDAVGNVLFVANALGAVTSTTYDTMNRKVSQVLPMPDATWRQVAPQSTWKYDLNGSVASTTDPLGHTTWFKYDHWNRLTQTTDAAGLFADDPQHRATTVYDSLGNVTSVTDQLGHQTQYIYDNLGRKIRTIEPQVSVSANGVDFQTTSPTTYYGYDANGNLKYVTDPRGAAPTSGSLDTTFTTYYFYDALNRQVCTLDALSSLDYTITNLPDAMPTTNPDHATTTTYDALGNVIAVKTPVDSSAHTFKIVTYQYDNLGRKITQTEYPETNSNPLTKIIDNSDPNNFSPTGAWYSTWFSGCYGADALECTTSATAVWTFHSLDPNSTYQVFATWGAGLNRGVASYDFYDGSTSDTWLGTNSVGQWQGSQGWGYLGQFPITGNTLSVKITYNGSGIYQVDADAMKVVKVVSGVPVTTTYNYDLDGNITSTVDPLGHTTYSKFDALNRQIRAVSAMGSNADDTHFATVTAYDAVGNVLTYTDPDGNTTSYSYDRLNRKTAETDPFLNSDKFQYDAAGELVQKTDRNGQVTKYLYDALGHEVEEDWLNADGSIKQWTRSYFDAAGQMTGVVDPGASYAYFYHAGGRLTESQMVPGEKNQGPTTTVNGALHDGQAEQAVDWNLDGVQELCDAYTPSQSFVAGESVLLRVTSTAFDPLVIAQKVGGNSTDWLIDDNSGGGTTATLLFTVPSNKTGAWTFFIASRLTSAQQQLPYTLEITRVIPAGGIPASALLPTRLLRLTNSYDAAGNQTSVIDNNGGKNVYQYDQLNRLTQIDQSGDSATAKRIVFTYYDDGSTHTIVRSVNGAEAATSTYLYDGMGRLTSLTHKKGATPLAAYTYQYDAASRMVYMTSPDGTTDLTNVAGGFGYDAADQLKGADFNFQADDSFTYDQNGNRVTSAAGATAWKTGAANRLLSDGTYTYLFDKEGNRTAKFIDANGDGAIDNTDSDITTYAWDYRNRLTSYTHYATASTYQSLISNQIVTYTYDSSNRQIRRGSGTTAVTATTYDVYAGSERYFEVNGPLNNIRYSMRYLSAVDRVFATDNCYGSVLLGVDDKDGTVRGVVNCPRARTVYR
jgi:YD repeat-containing protein